MLQSLLQKLRNDCRFSSKTTDTPLSVSTVRCDLCSSFSFSSSTPYPRLLRESNNFAQIILCSDSPLKCLHIRGGQKNDSFSFRFTVTNAFVRIPSFSLTPSNSRCKTQQQRPSKRPRAHALLFAAAREGTRRQEEPRRARTEGRSPTFRSPGGEGGIPPHRC